MQSKEFSSYVPLRDGSAVWVAGDLITFKLVGKDTGGQFAVAEDETPPGGGPPPHIHRREDELFYVLEGEYEFLIGDETIRAGAGSVVYGPRNVTHTFRNPGPDPAKMVAFVTPPGLEHFLSEVGAPAIEGSTAPSFGKAEIERMLAVAPEYDIEIKAPPPE